MYSLRFSISCCPFHYLKEIFYSPIFPTTEHKNPPEENTLVLSGLVHVVARIIGSFL
jgi:hypothetical protein